MKLLVGALFCALLFCIHATIDDTGYDWLLKIGKALRNESTYDDLRNQLHTRIDGNTDEYGPYAKEMKDVTSRFVDILKATMPRSAHPTQEKLLDLAHKFAESVRKLADVYTPLKDISEVVYKAAINTTLLTNMDNALVPAGTTPTPSNFAKLLKASTHGKSAELSGLFNFAASTRCISDYHASHLDADKKLSYEERKVVHAECRANYSFDPDEREKKKIFYSSEILQWLSSDKNSEIFVKDFAVLIETIKKPSSYESVDAFVAALAPCKRLHAAATIVQEMKRCLTPEVTPCDISIYEAVRDHVGRVMRMLFADEEEPNEEKMSKELLEFGSKAFGLSVFWHCDEKILDLNSTFVECIGPNEPWDKIDFVPLTGKETEEKKLLDLLKDSKAGQSIFVLFFEHLRAIRYRHGIDTDTSNFITKVLETVEGYETAKNRAQVEALNEQLRAEYIKLPMEKKKILADRFPLRTIAILSVLF